MGCSQPKLSRTGLRNILAFLKVKLQHFLGGTQVLLPLPVARGLRTRPRKGRIMSPVMRANDLIKAGTVWCIRLGEGGRDTDMAMDMDTYPRWSQ